MKSSVALGEEEGIGWVGWKETKLSFQRGTLCLIAPLIPDTSGIRGLAQIIPKGVFALPISFFVISQSKKVYNLDPN